MSLTFLMFFSCSTFYTITLWLVYTASLTVLNYSSEKQTIKVGSEMRAFYPLLTSHLCRTKGLETLCNYHPSLSLSFDLSSMCLLDPMSLAVLRVAKCIVSIVDCTVSIGHVPLILV